LYFQQSCCWVFCQTSHLHSTLVVIFHDKEVNSKWSTDIQGIVIGSYMHHLALKKNCMPKIHSEGEIYCHGVLLSDLGHRR
jgi:hypothetical protein